MVRVAFVTNEVALGNAVVQVHLFDPTSNPMVKDSSLTRHLDKFTLGNAKTYTFI